MTIKLVAIDMDETFLRTDKTYEVDWFKKIHKQLTEKGIITCIASGNSYHKLEQFFDEEDKEHLYFAGDNGNYIVKHEQVIETLGITRDQLCQIADFFDKLEGYHVSVSTGATTYFRESSGKAYEHVAKYNANLAIIDDFSHLPDDTLVTKIAVLGYHSLESHKQTLEVLHREFGHIVKAVTSGDNWIDLYHHEGGKGTGIRYLQDKYQIKEDETMVFGDSLNDTSMMKQAQFAVVMGNADPDLTKDARYQIGTNNEQAVLLTLERVIEDGLDVMEEYKL